MIFINTFLQKLKYINNKCVNDPLIFPIIAYRELMVDENHYDSNFSDSICDYVDNKEIRSIILSFTEIMKKISEKDSSSFSNSNSKKSYKRTDLYQKSDFSTNKFRIIELITFLSSIFAFGSRVSILKFLNDLFNFIPIFEIVEKDIFNIEFFTKKDIPYYRWINKKIVVLLTISLNIFYRNYLSIYDYCSNIIRKNPKITYLESMIFFSNKLFEIIEDTSNKKQIPLDKKEKVIIKNFLPQSLSSTSAKRYNLFLKWVIRRNFPDLGLWSRNDPSLFDQKNLFFPLDIHILEISSILFKYLIEESYFYFFEKEQNDYYKNYFEESFADFEKKLQKIMKSNKTLKSNHLKDHFNNDFYISDFNEIIALINLRYQDKDNKIKGLLKDFFNRIMNLPSNLYLSRVEQSNKFEKDEEKKVAVKFYRYLKNYENFFKNSFDRNSIFLNKKEHLQIITDFYKIFDEEDPLVFDLPISIIRSPILKEKRESL